MKNSIKIFALLILFSFNSNAQNNYQIKKATTFSEHAATQLELSDEDQKFIYDTYIAKFMNDRENIFGKDLSNEEKRAVYKASPLPSSPDDAVFDREILFYFGVN